MNWKASLLNKINSVSKCRWKFFIIEFHVYIRMHAHITLVFTCFLPLYLPLYLVWEVQSVFYFTWVSLHFHFCSTGKYWSQYSQIVSELLIETQLIVVMWQFNIPALYLWVAMKLLWLVVIVSFMAFCSPSRTNTGMH